MKTSLVLGGTRGIGSVITKTLRARGDKVITLSRRGLDDPDHISIDLSDESILEKLENTLPEKFDNIVFCQRYRGDDDKMDYQIMVEFTQNFIEKFIGRFEKEGCGILIGSNANRFVIAEQSSTYHSSRMGLENLAKFYAVRYGNKGVRFNCVMPTTILKPENKEFFFNEGENVRKMIEAITPLGRMGTSEDIANLIEFLCSEKASFITGQAFLVDGGTSLLSHESVIRSALNDKNPNAF